MDVEMLVRLGLVFIGLLFLLLAAAGAVLMLIQNARKVSAAGAGLESMAKALPAITKLTEAVTALLKTIATSPPWLALAVVGIALILLGVFLPMSF